MKGAPRLTAKLTRAFQILGIALNGQRQNPALSSVSSWQLVNIAILLCAYGLGQGSLFAAQSVLLFVGQHKLLSDFGLAFYTFTLCIILTDFGTSPYIAREQAKLEEIDNALLAQEIKGAWIIRIILSIAVVLFYLTVSFTSKNQFMVMFAVTASPAIIAYSCNMSGVLDGSSRSGLTGATSCIPFFTASLALVYCGFQKPQWSGAIIGSSVTFGHIIGILLQLIACSDVLRTVIFSRPPRIIPILFKSFGVLQTQLPGQIYFRLQLALCASAIGPLGTAAFIYAKQIVTACSQVIQLTRRTEFPSLVRELAQNRDRVIVRTLREQRRGTLIAVAMTLSIMILGALYLTLKPEEPLIGGTLVFLAPTILSLSVALSLVQGLFAKGRYRAAGATTICANLLAAAAALIIVPQLGLGGLVLADLVGGVAMSIIAGSLLMRVYGASHSRQRP